MRKLLLLSAALGLSFAAAQGKPANVAFIYWSTTLNAFQEMAMGVKQAAKETPSAKLTLAAPNAMDPAKVVTMFQSATQTSKQGILLQTLNVDLFSRPVKTTTSMGIPVISIDSPPPAGSGVDLFVGNDNVELGRVLAREILKDIPAAAKGEIVIGNHIPGAPPLEMRMQGMIEVIKKERPGVTIVGPLNVGGQNGSPTDNYNAWSAAVRAHPNALAFMAPSNPDAASLALIQKQTKKKLLVGGFDLEPEALQAVKDGYVKALMSPEHWMKGYIGMKQLLTQTQGGAKLPKGTWNSGGLLVTRANIDSIMARQKTESSRAAILVPIGKDQLANPTKYLTPGK